MKSADFWQGYMLAIEQMNEMLEPRIVNPVLDRMNEFLAQEMAKANEEVQKYAAQ